MRESLLEKIEHLRQQMMEIAAEFGMDHPDVLRYSQEIDKLHNMLMELENAARKKPHRRATNSLFILEVQAAFA
ncbi:Spo0E family sporulation regulatory protein-aspartic acid phosphatase [Brevibacillus sp. B_LB10_24]|uniref:Spo0E family sporulation regulatory protein-aspartic acid phosphatase n=1 Tax=Brevibacillus sp. B_LB10_24 TaxID=3380645 RepID=UPI0038BA3FB7